jgi:phosphopantetheinyl transferase (holo-ACP synthase)
MAHANKSRFAVKEAVIKAYETRRLTYHDIQILQQRRRNGMSRKPITMVVPEDSDWDNAQLVPTSISHDGGFATAVCMAYEGSPGATFETADDVIQAIPRTGKSKGASNHI